MVIPQHHLFTYDPEREYVICSNSIRELYARTTLVAHLDRNALSFVPWSVGLKQPSVVFYPHYVHQEATKGVLFELIKELDLDENQGILYGTSGSYVSQQSMGIFPTEDINQCKLMMSSWLNSNRLWLEKKPQTQRLLYSTINSRMEKWLDAKKVSV